MRSLPVTAEELESARSYLTGVFSLGVATQDGVLGQLSTVYLDRLPDDYLETYRERIRTLTAKMCSPPRAAISIPRTRKSSSSATASNRRASRAFRPRHFLRRERRKTVSPGSSANEPSNNPSSSAPNRGRRTLRHGRRSCDPRAIEIAACNAARSEHRHSRATSAGARHRAHDRPIHRPHARKKRPVPSRRRPAGQPRHLPR